MNVALAEKHPHYQARKVYAEWEDPSYGKVKGANVLPRLKNYPNQIWRGAPLYGQDNSDLLKEFGYTPEQIEEFYQKGVVKAAKGVH
jgi:L-carnitine CoA-transferase